MYVNNQDIKRDLFFIRKDNLARSSTTARERLSKECKPILRTRALNPNAQSDDSLNFPSRNESSCVAPVPPLLSGFQIERR